MHIFKKTSKLRWLVNSPHKWPVMFPFDNVIMIDKLHFKTSDAVYRNTPYRNCRMHQICRNDSFQDMLTCIYKRHMGYWYPSYNKWNYLNLVYKERFHFKYSNSWIRIFADIVASRQYQRHDLCAITRAIYETVWQWRLRMDRKWNPAHDIQCEYFFCSFYICMWVCII